MITAMATAIGAVGPEICDRVPPNTDGEEAHRDGAVQAGGRPQPRRHTERQ